MNLSRALESIFHAHGAIPRALWRSGRAFQPVHMLMEVTYRCNLRCNFCQYLDIIEGKTQPVGPVTGEIAGEHLMKRIDELRRGGLITFTGGEVLVRKDFPDILRHASRRHRTHIISNGALVDDDVARLYVDLAPAHFWQAGFVLLGVSLEGDEPRHDAIVKRPGSWQKTMDGLRSVIERRRAARKSYPKIHFNLVVTNETVAGLVDVMHLAHELGVDTVAFLAEHDLVGHAEGGRLDRLEVAQRRPTGVDPTFLRRQLVRCFELETPLGVQVRLSPWVPIDEFVRHYTDDRELDRASYVCEATWDRVAVCADGRYAPMCHYERAGDVRHDSMREMWNGPEFMKFRRALRRDRVYPGCNGCCNLRYVGPKKHGLAGIASPTVTAKLN